MTRLFVYGTLKRGCKNHHLMAAGTYVGDARTTPGYRMHDLGDFPGMVPDAADTTGVTGEVWTVSASALARLDLSAGSQHDDSATHRAARPSFPRALRAGSPCLPAAVLEPPSVPP